jgi:hypothetical protein
MSVGVWSEGCRCRGETSRDMHRSCSEGHEVMPVHCSHRLHGMGAHLLLGAAMRGNLGSWTLAACMHAGCWRDQALLGGRQRRQLHSICCWCICLTTAGVWQLPSRPRLTCLRGGHDGPWFEPGCQALPRLLYVSGESLLQPKLRGCCTHKGSPLVLLITCTSMPAI